MTKKNITSVYSFDKTTFVKFLDRKDFRLAIYNDISLEGFSCFCKKTIKIGEKCRVEINLKMVSGGLIDDLEPHIAISQMYEARMIKNRSVYYFKFIEFQANCFNNLVKAVDYLDKKEKLISLSDISYDNIETQDTMKEIVAHLSDSIKSGNIPLPVLPKIVKEVEDVLKKNNSTADDVANVIERDSVISAKIISTSNSSFYRGLSHIVTIKEAIPRLGLEEIQNMVLTIANKSLYHARNVQYKSLLEKLWLHSLACACNSKAIAMELDISNADIFFSLGLVHDIGQTMLLRVIGEMTSLEKSFKTNDIINSTYAYTPDLSRIILEFWKFPEDFTNAVVTHNAPMFDNATDRLTLILNLSNFLAIHSGYGIRNEEIDIANLESAKSLEISPDVLNTIGKATELKMAEAISAF